METDFYVYEWYNIDTKEVFYVGKGKGYRYKDIKTRNQYFKNYYNKYKCDVRKVKTDLTEDEAFALEIDLISKYRAVNQAKCNLTNGGEGATFPKGSRNDLLQKLQYLHDVKGAMDDMINEEEYDTKNLKTKTLEELRDLYEQYIDYKENEILNWRYFESIDLETNKIDGFELKTQNEELIMLTELFANRVAEDNKQFKEFLEYKTEMDFICCSFNTNKFLSLIISNNDYCYELISTLINVLWFMKQISLRPDIKVFIKIKSYNIRDNYINIKFNTSDDKTRRRVKINLYDIMWGILMFKSKSLFQIIFDEIFSAPFIQ